jgi:hypothetical protein
VRRKPPDPSKTTYLLRPIWAKFLASDASAFRAISWSEMLFLVAPDPDEEEDGGIPVCLIKAAFAFSWISASDGLAGWGVGGFGELSGAGGALFSFIAGCGSAGALTGSFIT